jgi:hypothetical protein
MFSKSTSIRLALGACLAAAWLPIGNGLMWPAQARADEIVRVGPVLRVAPVVPRAVVAVNPVVPVAPVVRVGPVYPRPWYPRYGYRYWYGYRWRR